MPVVFYREALKEDIPFLAKIRGEDPDSEVYWNDRILGYMNGTHHPQQALGKRIIYVAYNNETIVGFVAGHLTERYNCNGELQWINVIKAYRRDGIASSLMKILANWFVKQKAFNICVDPGDDIARRFYERNGAIDLNNHWMFWKDIRNLVSS